jgi:hypothetical protein
MYVNKEENKIAQNATKWHESSLLFIEPRSPPYRVQNSLFECCGSYTSVTGIFLILHISLDGSFYFSKLGAKINDIIVTFTTIQHILKRLNIYQLDANTYHVNSY